MNKYLSFSKLVRLRFYLPRKVVKHHLEVVQRQDTWILVATEKHSIKINNTTVIHSKNRLFSFTKYLSFGYWRQNIFQNMTALSSCVLNPPETTKGMKKLDKSAFKKMCQFPGFKIPYKTVGKLTKKLKSSLAKIPRLKAVAELGENDPLKNTHKLFLFDPLKIKCPEDFNEEEMKTMTEFEIDFKNLQWFDTELGYDNWSASEIIRAILPDGIQDNVSGFSTIGHIAHLNLKDEVLDYKNIIGEVILDRNSPIKTVVNKLNIIDNTFRNFQMELLAGEENYVTTAKENGCAFEFDFSKVYWNSRLGSEHKRLVDIMKKGDVLYDIFSGVGPFAIPAAKKGVTVFANDLNPESFKSLQRNITINKIKSQVKTYNMDGREFIKNVVKDDLIKKMTSPLSDHQFNLHVAMNLPAMALEFLDSWKFLLNRTDIPQSVSQETIENMLPTVHCYCFTKSVDAEEDVLKRAENILGMNLPENHAVRYVRNVAPNKEMMCLTFKVTTDLIFTDNLEEPEAKKQKVSQ